MSTTKSTGLNQNQTVNQIVLVNLKHDGVTYPVTVQVAWNRHPDINKPFKTENRRRLDFIECHHDFNSYYLGRQPLSEFTTVCREGAPGVHYFTQLEIAIVVPEVCADQVSAFRKSFYPSPGKLKEVNSFHLGDKVIFASRFPVKHSGKTANSRVGTDENRNNLYLAIRGKDSFVIYAVAVVIDQNGAWLVTSQPYQGTVFKSGNEVHCPVLEVGNRGRTQDPLLQLVREWYKDVPLSPIPQGYRADVPVNTDVLQRGKNQHAEWADVFVHMDSIARQISFGLCKLDAGTSQHVYIDWDELPIVKGNMLRRVLPGMVVRGNIVREEKSTRVWLKEVRFLDADTMAAKSLAVRDPDRIELLGESIQEPEWIQKQKIKTEGLANIGQVFAKLFNSMIVPAP